MGKGKRLMIVLSFLKTIRTVVGLVKTFLVWVGNRRPIYMARSGKSTFPVTITEKIQVLLQSSPSGPLVRLIIKSKSREYSHASTGVFISTLIEEFKKYIEPFVDHDVSKYSTHGMRSGAASNPAYRRIAVDLSFIGYACWVEMSSLEEQIHYAYD